MKNPLVSIIIPCWNAERYVGKAIESALAQTYPNIEVIVIDDGSTDGSLSVIQSFGEAVRWERTPNRGANAARNRGLSLSRGELIHFLDADDIIFPNKLEFMVPHAVAAGPGSIVTCDWVECSEDGDLIKERKRISAYNGEDPFCYLLQKLSLHTGAVLYWKNDLQTIGPLDEWLTCSQDLDWNLKLFAKGVEISYVDKPLLSVTRTQDSVSSNYIKVMDQHIIIAGRLIESGLLSKDQKKALSRFIAQDARNYMYFGQITKSRLYHLAAKEIDKVAALDVFSGVEKALAKFVGSFTADLIRFYVKRCIKTFLKLSRHG